MTAPGATTRLGVLVPSSNSNAESSIQRMLSSRDDVAAHMARFRLPASLSDRIDADVLGDAPMLLADVEPQAVAFHGTSGSWTGFDGDRRLCAELAAITDAPATTATLSVLAALEVHSLRRIGLVFPGPRDIAAEIGEQYRTVGIDAVVVSAPDVMLSNPEIARVDATWIDDLMRPAFAADSLDAVVCIGTNLRSAYRVSRFESEFGIPVIDSATATLWQMLVLSGADSHIDGWGRLLAGKM